MIIPQQPSIQGLIIGLLDYLNQLKSLQVLVELSLEQFELSPEEIKDRVPTLLHVYLTDSEPCFQELTQSLESLLKQLAGDLESFRS